MRGRIEIIRGCMFSGKSTELIRRLESAPGAVAIKPAGDTRAGGAWLTTHTGRRMAAAEAARAEDVARIAAGAGVVGIDEAHFFGAELADVCRGMRAAGKRAIIAGVALDHFGDPFEPFASLLGDADEVMELTCPCAACGRPAIHSQRMGKSTERISVGGAGEYEARCERCFVPSTRAEG